MTRKQFRPIRKPTFMVLMIAGAFVLLLAASIVLSAQDQVCQFTIRAGSWVSTGVRLEQGQKAIVKASGTMRYAGGGRIEFGPGGDMYGAFALWVRIGQQLVKPGRDGTITATETGTIELGILAHRDLPITQNADYMDPNHSLCVSVHPESQQPTGSGSIGAFMYWCPETIAQGETQPCSICIQDWRLSSDSGGNMTVRFPNTTSSWGWQANGIWVFPAGFSRDPITRWEGAIWDWGGYQCSKHAPESGVIPGGRPKVPFSREYPWGFLIAAGGTTPPGQYDLPIIISQVNGGTVNLNLRLNVVAGASRFRCGLGRLWNESESGWTGTWTRRGDTSVFDARWVRAGYNPIDQVLSIYLSSNSVNIFRQDPAVPGNTCTYKGTVAIDGVTVTGEYTCNDRGRVIGPAPWRAVIDCTGSGGSTSNVLSGKFAIRTGSWNYLTAVRGGGIQGPGAINTDAKEIGAWETFTLVPLPDGKYAIQTANGNYLTAMRGGGLTGLDTIHTDARQINDWEKFTLENIGGSKWAIRTINGNYLTAVGGGGVGSGKAAIHTNATAAGAWESFWLMKL